MKKEKITGFKGDAVGEGEGREKESRRKNVRHVIGIPKVKKPKTPACKVFSLFALLDC